MGSCEAGVLLVVPDGSFWWFDIEGGCDVIGESELTMQVARDFVVAPMCKSRRERMMSTPRS